MRVGMLKGINFNSGLNITVPSYSATAIAYKGAKIVTIRQNEKRIEFWAYFLLRMRTNGYLGASGARFTKNRKCYLWATYDKWNLWQTYDNGRGVFRKSYIITENQNKVFDAKLITILVQFVCHIAMLEGFDSFYNDVNYDEVTKTHNMQLCAVDEGPFN